MNACWLDVVFKISYKYQALAILLRTLQPGAQNIEVPGSNGTHTKKTAHSRKKTACN